jgi:hypothetical protein
MLFEIRDARTLDRHDKWALWLNGKLIAFAEGVDLVNVTTQAGDGSRKLVGEIKATWGLTIVDPATYEDPKILRSLCIGKAFNIKADEPLLWRENEIACPESGFTVYTAKRMLFIGPKIYGKGVD